MVRMIKTMLSIILMIMMTAKILHPPIQARHSKKLVLSLLAAGPQQNSPVSSWKSFGYHHWGYQMFPPFVKAWLF